MILVNCRFAIAVESDSCANYPNDNLRNWSELIYIPQLINQCLLYSSKYLAR